MKKKLAVAAFGIAAGLAVILRLCQMLAFTEYQTGFIKRESKILYIIIAVIIALLSLAVPIFALFCRPAPKQSRSFDLVASLSGILLGGICIFDFLCLYSSPNDVPAFLKITCMILGALSAAYFLAAGLRSILYFPFSPKFAAIPPAFLTVRAAAMFIACSRHAVVSDTVFEVFIYCAAMLFTLEIARAVNGAASNKSGQKIVFFGLTVSVLSLSYALPKLILGIFYADALHDGAVSSVLALGLGIYAAALVFSRFDFGVESTDAVSIYYSGKH